MFKIEIDKESLPYKFELNIKGAIYDFIIGYNTTYDFFTVTLIKDQIILIESEKAILNQRLFNTLTEPSANMGIVNISSEAIDITFENLNLKTAFVYEEI